ncbi:MAG: hypothetical protein BWY74_02834 [Firmicutes bacterium ADurb.Bin419]|nr:MAG: hypothetical protein BWY74_02834 [Firmicutes bacterium ADurb.Bin419]
MNTEGDNVNEQLKKIIPEMRRIPNYYYPTTKTIDYYEGWNACREEVCRRVAKNNLVVCPSLEELRLFISSEYYPRDERATLLAKALLALLHRTAPNGVSNSATQEKR